MQFDKVLQESHVLETAFKISPFAQAKQNECWKLEVEFDKLLISSRHRLNK